jgi:hypothetical protein
MKWPWQRKLTIIWRKSDWIQFLSERNVCDRKPPRGQSGI